MENLFDGGDRDGLLARLVALDPSSARRWGRMTPAQMLAHCASAFDYPLGQKSRPQPLLGRIVTPFLKARVLGPAPFGRNGPTAPDLVVADGREFEPERQRLVASVVDFCEAGRGGVNNRRHPFFGPLTGDEWGRLMFKHLDHHLRQFGA